MSDTPALSAAHRHAQPYVCPICHHTRTLHDRVHAAILRPSLLETIQKEHPEWKHEEGLCQSCLNHYRARLVQEILENEKGDVTRLEQEVLDSLSKQELLAQNINTEFDSQLSFGERVADKMAEFGGSWAFLLSFGGVLMCWIIVNAGLLLRHPFDPYPFILLNLVLSCLASVQAPVIMMSQNRQESKDRLRAEHDYQINLKAELEIRQLHIKLDQLLNHQWQHLLEIQQVQTELMEEIAERKKKG